MTGNEDVITEQPLAGESPGPRYGLNATATAMTLDELATMIDSMRNGSPR